MKWSFPPLPSEFSAPFLAVCKFLFKGVFFGVVATLTVAVIHLHLLGGNLHQFDVPAVKGGRDQCFYFGWYVDRDGEKFQEYHCVVDSPNDNAGLMEYRSDE